VRGKFHRVVIVILFSRAGFSQVERWRGCCVEGRFECDCFVYVSAVRCFFFKYFYFSRRTLRTITPRKLRIVIVHIYIRVCVCVCVCNKLFHVHRLRAHTIIHANDNIIIHPIRSAICSLRRRVFLYVDLRYRRCCFFRPRVFMHWRYRLFVCITYHRFSI
jgi:hypothetical protein